MTIQTPEQVAEAVMTAYWKNGPKLLRELITDAIAADRRVLLSENEDLIEEMDNAAVQTALDYVPGEGELLHRKIARALLAVIRLHHGVEP